MSLLIKSSQKSSSRNQIRIKEVTDGILVLPDNNYRLVLETSSVNFELKSEAEQDILIENFQHFLNSLPSKLQIMIRVRELDIDQYVTQISGTRKNETEKVYQEQISQYCLFIRELVSGNKILSRRFYIIIPYHSPERKQDLSFIKEQLNLSRDIVIRGLEKLGMKATQLSTIEILNLFYSFYNPAQYKTQPLTTDVVKSLLINNYA